MADVLCRGYAGRIPVYCSHDKIVPIGDVMPNPKNPNQHPENQIEMLAKIITTQGWRAPITVSTLSGLVVRGHGRLMAAQFAGMTHVPVDFQHYESEQDELSDLLADNRIAELAEADNRMLSEIFARLDLETIVDGLTGFTSDEVTKICDAFSYTDATPDEFGEEFVLDTSDSPKSRKMTFYLDEEQFAVVTAVLKAIKEISEKRSCGKSSDNGNLLYKVVKEWAEQKKLSLR